MHRPSLGSRLAVRFALLLLLVAVVVAVWLRAVDQLNWSGPRVVYFLYIAGLSLVGLIVSRWPKLAWTLLVLALIELSWGVGSFATRTDGDEEGLLLPPKVAEPQRFRWHPLLQAELIPSLAFTSRTNLAISHTSAGTRGREPRPQDIEGHVVVALYGGSSTYDLGVGEGDTWSDRLADALGRDRYFVVNNGVPGYTSVEHVVQTTFYQNKFGRAPRCAVYYIGWNDLRNAHIPNLDPAYANFHLISQVDVLSVRRFGGRNISISPTLTLVSKLLAETVDTIRYAPGVDPYAMAPISGDDPALMATFERNVRTMSAINRSRGIPSIWVGQLVNRAAFTGDGRYGWLPLVRDRDVPPLLDDLNDRLMHTARDLGDASISIPADSFGAADFFDNGHFSVQGAKRFAGALMPTVRDVCR